jgi:hypothetical protein
MANVKLEIVPRREPEGYCDPDDVHAATSTAKLATPATAASTVGLWPIPLLRIHCLLGLLPPAEFEKVTADQPAAA